MDQNDLLSNKVNELNTVTCSVLKTNLHPQSECGFVCSDRGEKEGGASVSGWTNPVKAIPLNEPISSHHLPCSHSNTCTHTVRRGDTSDWSLQKHPSASTLKWPVSQQRKDRSLRCQKQSTSAQESCLHTTTASTAGQTWIRKLLCGLWWMTERQFG